MVTDINGRVTKEEMVTFVRVYKLKRGAKLKISSTLKSKAMFAVLCSRIGTQLTKHAPPPIFSFADCKKF